MDHLGTPATAIHVVAAVTLELDHALALRVFDLEEQRGVRICDTQLLHDALDLDGLAEIELRGRVMRPGAGCHCQQRERHRHRNHSVSHRATLRKKVSTAPDYS